jgi:hypothetical protein
MLSEDIRKIESTHGTMCGQLSLCVHNNMLIMQGFFHPYGEEKLDLSSAQA